MVLLAQQATGSSAAIHYTSPRLRREAKEDTITLVNQFQSMMTNIILAKREEAFVIAKQLQDAQEMATGAQQQVAEAQEKIHSQEAEIAEIAALVRGLEARLQLLQNKGH